VINANAKELIFAGLDVGSLSSKAVLLGVNGILSQGVIPTGANPRLAGEEVFERVLAAVGKDKKQVAYLVGTGYGRVNLPFADRTATELTCHAKGAHYFNPAIRTVIDIGGQDSKVIRLDSAGNMIDFAMNDKCAAGTGRFLEVMAKALDLKLEELGECAQKAEQTCPINSICAVFAESEVISLLASGQEKENIAAGLHQAVAQRVGTMAQRIGLVPDIAFAGGVAKNPGVVHALEKFLGIKFVPCSEDPQINGAAGAAVLAREFYCSSPICNLEPATCNHL
jgi:predicted CoA-substrate-specific enzyme activase